MSIEKISTRIMLGVAMLGGLAIGARIGDVSDALFAGVAGIALSVSCDLAHDLVAAAWPGFKRWWTR